ncbi:hypothetical protein ACFYXF_24535 [Streptomyces sp. NPDC002680]|uniref:hypothetical protein n=1 Tax=Streptomyces sp. NPDC002680 TaxID=3364659 RepID=UPI00369BEE13
MKRTALPLSLLCLAAALTACSADGEDNKETADKPKASASVSASQAKQAGPAERVAQLLVTKAEAGDFSIAEPAANDALAKSQSALTSDKADCAPLSYALNELPIGTSEASLVRVTNSAKGMVTYITLATYATGKAEAAMQGLTTAASTCRGGFTAKSSAGATTYDSVTVETAPADGDESLATATTFTYRGATQTLRTQTFRFGDTIANYFTLNSNAFLQGGPGNAEIPAALVKAQNAKLA